MDIVLIAGLWLDGTVWSDVASRLAARGHHAVPVTLPGQGDGNTSATLADQIAVVLAAVDSAAGSPMVVGHSAACGLAWIAADARPAKVSKIALIGGFPPADGEAYFSGLPARGGAIPFPGWAPFEGPDSDDLDEAARQAFAAAAIPVPESVTTSLVALTDERRYDTPLAMICPEFSPADVREWIDKGELPELAKSKNVSYLDIDSGHWPMISAPDDLAEMLSHLAEAT